MENSQNLSSQATHVCSFLYCNGVTAYSYYSQNYGGYLGNQEMFGRICSMTLIFNKFFYIHVILSSIFLPLRLT